MDCNGCNKCTEVHCSIDTKCQQLDRNLMDHWGAISFPIYQTATFAHPGLGESTGYDYTRMQNPTRKQLESIVAYLENGLHGASDDGSPYTLQSDLYDLLQ